MKTKFDKDYKLMAVNRVKESGKPVAEVVHPSMSWTYETIPQMFEMSLDKSRNTDVRVRQRILKLVPYDFRRTLELGFIRDDLTTILWTLRTCELL